VKRQFVCARAEVGLATYGHRFRTSATLRRSDAELRLVSRCVARHMSGCTPITAHIDALLDERFVNHAARVYQSCVDPGGTAP
jgi:hypothetical protein